MGAQGPFGAGLEWKQATQGPLGPWAGIGMATGAMCPLGPWAGNGMATQGLWNKGVATQGPGQGPGPSGSKGTGSWAQWIQGPRALGPSWDQWIQGPWDQWTRHHRPGPSGSKGSGTSGPGPGRMGAYGGSMGTSPCGACWGQLRPKRDPRGSCGACSIPVPSQRGPRGPGACPIPNLPQKVPMVPLGP